MKETILRDGEIAILVGGVEIIMNDNTLLGLLGKFGLVEKAEKPAKSEELLAAIIAKFSGTVTPVATEPAKPACPPCPYHDGTCAPLSTKPVAVFEYDKDKVDSTSNRYAGLVRRVKWFESAQDAEAYYGISKGRVSAIARSWAYIIEKSWNKKVANKNQYADKNEYSGTYEWGYPYSFSATDCDGNALAFIYIEDLPKTGFLV